MIFSEVNGKIRDVVSYQLAIVHYVSSIILVQIVDVYAGSSLEISLSLVLVRVQYNSESVAGKFVFRVEKSGHRRLLFVRTPVFGRNNARIEDNRRQFPSLFPFIFTEMGNRILSERKALKGIELKTFFGLISQRGKYGRYVNGSRRYGRSFGGQGIASVHRLHTLCGFHFDWALAVKVSVRSCCNGWMRIARDGKNWFWLEWKASLLRSHDWCRIKV